MEPLEASAGCTRTSRLLVLSATLLAGALLGACGGSTANQSAASREQRAETKLDDYARCMREHGYDAEVATMPTGGRGLKIRPGKGFGPGASEAAARACARYQPEAQAVNLSPQQKVEREDAVQKYARCMRRHGIEVEASTKGGGIQITLHGHPGAGGPNPESPAFQRAQTSCRGVLPGGGPR